MVASREDENKKVHPSYASPCIKTPSSRKKQFLVESERNIKAYLEYVYIYISTYLPIRKHMQHTISPYLP